MASVKELEKALLEAGRAGDVAKILDATDALKEGRRAEAKELRAKADAEFEATSAARADLTGRFNEAVGKVVAQFKAEIVKLVGDEAFPHYSIDYKNGDAKVVGIIRARAKAPSKGGGGAPRGATKNEFGLSLGEVFEKFATVQDRADYDKAASGSSQWQVKVRVKKTAINAGLLKPVS